MKASTSKLFYNFEVIKPLPGVPVGTIFFVHKSSASAVIPTVIEASKDKRRRRDSPITYHALRVPLELVLQDKDFFKELEYEV
jgi:hypothetical protein